MHGYKWCVSISLTHCVIIFPAMRQNILKLSINTSLGTVSCSYTNKAGMLGPGLISFRCDMRIHHHAHSGPMSVNHQLLFKHSQLCLQNIVTLPYCKSYSYLVKWNFREIVTCKVGAETRHKCKEICKSSVSSWRGHNRFCIKWK